MWRKGNGNEEDTCVSIIICDNVGVHLSLNTHRRKRNMDKELGLKSTKMHKSFFDKAQIAIDEGYYLEAIMFEYAAIEGRLEVICGLLGCPCNKNLPDGIRKDIKIGKRIECLKVLYKSHPACSESVTKLDSKYWKKLKEWTRDRNIYVHGLFKRPELYVERLDSRKQLADDGLELARVLYNEAKRLRRIEKNHPVLMIYEGNRCKKEQCFKLEEMR